MSGYTPAPWEAINLDGDIFPSVYIGPELRYSDNSGSRREKIVVNAGPHPKYVAKGINHNSMETCQANARLIAAAPELLDALDRIYRAHKSGNNGAVMGEAVLCKHFETMARIALAKATGEDR